MENKKDLLRLIDRFSGLQVLVYGDFVLDEFLYGQIERISREAPVFIVNHQYSDFRPGCAANAVANLAALAAAAIPCGVIGDDEAAGHLLAAFERLGVNANGLLKVPGTRTALKTRVIAGGPHSVKQQIVRVDRLNGSSPSSESERTVRERIAKLLPACDAVLISDYGVGGLTAETAAWLVSRARESYKPVLADSRYRVMNYIGCTAMTPNKPEVEECLGRRIDKQEGLHRAGIDLLAKLKSEALVITRGGEGMTLFLPNEAPLDIPAFGDEEVVDVTGAGDTVIASFTLGVAAGRDFVAAAKLANIAGGLTVLKKGTSVVSTDELRKAIEKAWENG